MSEQRPSKTLYLDPIVTTLPVTVVREERTTVYPFSGPSTRVEWSLRVGDVEVCSINDDGTEIYDDLTAYRRLFRRYLFGNL